MPRVHWQGMLTEGASLAQGLQLHPQLMQGLQLHPQLTIVHRCRFMVCCVQVPRPCRPTSCATCC